MIVSIKILLWTHMKKLYECMEIKKVNTSQAREAIYKLLLEVNSCMSVADITHKLAESYQRKVSLNTIYRHLTLFVDCGLVIVLQDDHKKAYYCVCGNKAKAFSICPKCSDLSEVNDGLEVETLLSTLKAKEFITVHKVCKACA